MKKIILTLFCILTPFYISANTFESDMLNCSLLTDDQARLLCYDNRLKQQQTDISVNSEPQKPMTVNQDKSTIKDKNQVVQKANAGEVDDIAQLGAKHLKSKSDEDKEKKSFIFIVKEVKKNLYGKLRLTFENGQKWQQADETRVKIRPGDKMIVMEGFLGAIYMKKQGSNKKIRVKRLA